MKECVSYLFVSCHVSFFFVGCLFFLFEADLPDEVLAELCNVATTSAPAAPTIFLDDQEDHEVASVYDVHRPSDSTAAGPSSSKKKRSEYERDNIKQGEGLAREGEIRGKSHSFDYVTPLTQGTYVFFCVV